VLEGENGVCFSSPGFLVTFYDPSKSFLYDIFYDILFLAFPTGNMKGIDKGSDKRVKRQIEICTDALAAEIRWIIKSNF